MISKEVRNEFSGVPLAFVRFGNSYGIRDIDGYLWDEIRSYAKKYEKKGEEASTRYLLAGIGRSYAEPYAAEVVFEFSSSDDGVFRLTAQAQSIKAITSVEFIEMHKESKKDLNDWIKNVNSQSKDTLLIEEDVYGKEKVATNASVGKKGIEIIEKSIDSNVATKEGKKMLPDNRPVHELKKYISDFTDPVISYLVACGIRTIGDFCILTEGKVKNFPAKGKQMVYKNTVMRSVKQMNTIIPRIR